jgi:hypothetical protein
VQPWPREKDLIDTVIDFFVGAAGGLLLAWFISSPQGRGFRLWQLHSRPYFTGGCLLSGTMTSLFRERFRSPSLLENAPRDPSKFCQIILWILAVAGGATVAFAFLRCGFFLS